MTITEYYEKFGTRITQDSEKLFVEDFLAPILGPKLSAIVPQSPFIDRTGSARRIDFAYINGATKLALEVNGETYHAEGIIPDSQFDDNLFRQNEILRKGYRLLRFSYSQLKAPHWRPLVMESLRQFFADYAPDLLSEYSLEPTQIQIEALDALAHARAVRGWSKGVVVMPTGTGKTILSALDAKRFGGRVLFLVHRLDILTQSVDAYRKVWGALKDGILTGAERNNEMDCEVLFASKDTLRQPDQLRRFDSNWFDYIVIDEVHHGQSPSYQPIFDYFEPKFMLGMTGTPDRTDRKDIFELFDYNKIYEIPLSDVIERGWLVPYTYVGLTDNVDYTKIRYQNNRYRVEDLERLLLIPERNKAILNAYVNRGKSGKAIGFCCSIAHSERMAQYFNDNGIKASAIHSESPNRESLVRQFRTDEIQVAFTVDLFNEGVDFPNVRNLLFLRPTESKTVFFQQLGRGLRLCVGKERVTVLDFIGNYQRANQIRKYLSKKNKQVEEFDEDGRRKRKIVYEYSTGCEVQFDAEVEEILDRQDVADLGVDKTDLSDAYFRLAEELHHKPTKQELDTKCQYPSRLFIQLWGTWVKFLRDVGEYTEASFHYPQGVHLGHLLSIVWYFGLTRLGTHLDDKFIRMRGNLGEGRIGMYQRQLKYKLQAAMELGLLTDDRELKDSEATVHLELTPLGHEFRRALTSSLKKVDLAFRMDSDGMPSSNMPETETFYNEIILNLVRSGTENKALVLKIFLRMPAVQQMLAYLYHIERKPVIEKASIYQNFFQSPFVKRFCEQEGIEEATIEAARRRCPFLLNVLAACGVIDNERSAIRVKVLLLLPSLVRPYESEDMAVTSKRMDAVCETSPIYGNKVATDDISILRELFGASFLTASYFLTDFERVEV